MSTELTVNTISRDGIEVPSFQTDATGEFTVPRNDGNVWLELASTSGATVSFTKFLTADGDSLPAATVVVPAGESVIAGPWPPAVYNGSDGAVHLASSDVAVQVRAYGL